MSNLTITEKNKLGQFDSLDDFSSCCESCWLSIWVSHYWV